MSRVDEAIDFLAKTDVPKQKNRTGIESSLAVDTVAAVASDEGLEHDQITRLVDLATSGKFAESVSARLVKSLIPKASVPVIAVVKAISRICTNKLSIHFQDLLIRWIVIVYNLIDDVRDLHLLYGVIFLFLESDILCPHVCHLLYYLTRKEDVKHFRIKKLLDLQNRTGTKPYLTGLLSLYPISMATSAKNKKVWFKLSDRPWREAIKKVQKKYQSKSPVDSFYLALRNTASPPIAKKRRIITCSIPVVQTAMTKDPWDNIDNIEFPSQAVSVLNSRFLQHVVSCNPDLVVLQRLNFWLNQSLYEEFLADGASESDLFGLRLLQKLKQFTSFLQESIPAVDAFLVRYLFSWNGLDYRPLVLELITYLGLWPFQRLNDLVLEPLRKLFYSTQVYVKCQVMYCFTELLRHFLTVELSRKRQLQPKEQTDGAPANSRLVHDYVTPSNTHPASLFVEDDMEPFAPLKTIYDFIQFVDRICVVALQAEEDHPLLQHWVLNFFELVSTSHQRFDLPFVLIPSSGIIYRMLFSSNSMAVSRLCSIIVNYKMEFESLKKAQAKSQSVAFAFPDGFQSIQRFNQYILDICDSLWRNKAFVDREKSLCFSMPSSVTDSLFVRHMNESFSIHHHMSLVGEAWKFLHQTQPQGMKLTPSLIKKKATTSTAFYDTLDEEHELSTLN